MNDNVSAPVIRKIQAVTIDRMDGQQTTLKPGDRVYSSRYGGIALGMIPNALADPTCWIEYDTEAEWASAEEREPWQEPEEPCFYRARARIYARAVVECMVIYEEPA